MIPLKYSFDCMWKEDLALAPEVPLNWEERERWKIFAQKVYKRCEEALDAAYDAGYEEGLKEGDYEYFATLNES